MKYPIGIQDFEKLRTEGYVYVDKTQRIYDLANSGCYYFLGRPRRFGKSLLLSTIEAYFSGKKELFGGLAMETLEKEWPVHPILHLDLNTGKYETESALYDVLNNALTEWERQYGSEESEVTPELRFKGIIRRAFEHSGRRVVILVDEYDKPMVQSIGNEELQDKFRSTLKAFYSVMKTQDRYIRFAFLTGVSKFSKVSIFSDLNNLNDISMDVQYADICGITEEEMLHYFDEPIRTLASSTGVTYEAMCAKLREQYDGYHFEYDAVGVYNPFSLLNTFAKQRFKDYWFETGTPTFLVQLMKRSNYKLANLPHEEVTADMLNSIDSALYNPVPIIYQSGYLTVKAYDERFKVYTLGFPNKEVENGFVRYLMPYYIPKEEKETEFFISGFVNDVEKGDADGFMSRLQALFMDGDYAVQGDMELYFQNSMFVIFKVMGFYVEVERRTSRGRIDMVVKTNDYIYVIEIKLDGTADEALRQIKDKGYAEPFAHDGRTVYQLGVNFSSRTKGIDEWKLA